MALALNLISGRGEEGHHFSCEVLCRNGFLGGNSFSMSWENEETEKQVHK